MVDGLAGIDIGAHHRKTHGPRREGLAIHRVKHKGNLAVGKVATIQVARAQPGPQACIAWIARIVHVVAQHAANLARLKVVAKSSTRRDAHHAVGSNAVLHPYVQHARRV